MFWEDLWNDLKKKGKNAYDNFIGDAHLNLAAKVIQLIPNYKGINLYKINDSYYLDILKKYLNSERSFNEGAVKIITKTTPIMQKLNL